MTAPTMPSSPKLKKVSPGLIPLSVIRTETVLSRLPIHNLSKKGAVRIRITRKNENGEVELLWNVSPNPDYGDPRQLAYKLDTIVINQKIDGIGKPLPKLIRLGSLRQICADLGLSAGKIKTEVKQAFLQNAATFINAKLHYKCADGTEQTLEAGFTRYSVIFTGERLPDGSKADAVYLVLNDPYWEVLNNAPTRPLDYEYLKSLGPAAQRFYELMSYKIYAALKYRHPTAKISYLEYCTYSAQQHYEEYKQVKKQMYKVHLPHLKSGYLEKVAHETTVNSEGKQDWIFHYTPGPKAQAEFKAFNGRHAKIADSLDQELVLPLEDAESSWQDDTGDFVRYFHRRFHDTDTRTPTPNDLKYAAELITKYGIEQARFIVEYSWEEAQTTKYSPKWLVGIRQYVDAAIETFAARAKQRENMRQQEATRRQEEQLKAQYEHYRDQEIDRIKSTMAPADLAAMESSIRTDLRAKGSVYHASELMIRIEKDKQLASRAGVLPYDEWRTRQSKT